jgi:hypothetical protein
LPRTEGLRSGTQRTPNAWRFGLGAPVYHVRLETAVDRVLNACLRKSAGIVDAVAKAVPPVEKWIMTAR